MSDGHDFFAIDYGVDDQGVDRADPLPPWAEAPPPRKRSRWERFWRNVRARYWFARLRLSQALHPNPWDDE